MSPLFRDRLTWPLHQITPGSSNGRTHASGAWNHGSNPCPGTLFGILRENKPVV